MNKRRNRTENEQYIIKDIKPKTINQNNYIRTVAENDVTICHGPAGTGKTILAIHYACEKLISQQTSKILVSRTIVGCDNELGAMPGHVMDKIGPYMTPYIEYFEDIIGKSKFEYYFHNKNIMLYPVELLRGHTYNNSIMILEEAQNCTPHQIKLFMSRIGMNSKIIILGDNKQSDIRQNGLSFCLKIFQKSSKIGICELNYRDILRHPIIPEIIETFDKNGV